MIIMESGPINIKMEFEEFTNSDLGAFWSPAFEADSFNAFVSDSRGDGATTSTSTEHRRKLASELLQLLEESQKQLTEEPYNGWLEEPMDLEIFGQSVMEASPSSPLDEAETSYITSAPSSPLPSHPATPLHPASPQGLYPSQDELPTIKFDPSTMVVPAEGEELLRSWESLLSQTETSPSGSPEVAVHEDDIAAELLDSLINGEVTEDQVIDELADFSLALMEPSTVDQATLSQLTNIPTPATTYASSNSSSSSESEDADWAPQSSSSGRRGGRSVASSSGSDAALRKPRRKAMKVEDRRLRKKEQNKSAATRYRIKKKAELDLLLDEEAQLEERNRQLQAQHDELASEVRYLKKLMREVFCSRTAGSR